MPPILRQEPGEPAYFAGTYALVGHYGESTGFALWCEQGERLPLAVVAADYGPFWYVRVGQYASDAQAA